MNMLDEFRESYNEFIIKKAEYFNVPILGTFELTPICNMKCKMCYIQQEGQSVLCKGGLKNIDFWESVIDQAVDEGMLFCLLTGGEIFTYPHFKELYTKLKTKGIHIVLNTNGTLLDEDTIKWLAQDPPRRLNISLYGSSEETYEKLCQNRDGFNKVMRAFELLNQYRIPYRVHGVMVPTNIHDYEGIKEICNHFRAPLEMSYYMFPPVRKEKDKLKVEERFTTDEMAKIAFMYRKDQCGGEGEVWRNYVAGNIHLIDNCEENKLYGFNKSACKAGCCSFWVNWKGQVGGCGIGGGKLVDLDEVNFKEAWNQIRQFTEEITLSNDCAICKYRCICPICSAAAYCETGQIDGTPEYLCEFSKKYASLLRKEFERIKNDE